MATMSPACASSSASLSSPRNARILEIRPLSSSAPSRLSTFTAWFGLIEPEWMRPVMMRPRNGLASRIVPIIRNGPSPTFGSGTCFITSSNSGSSEALAGRSGVSAIQPSRPEPYRIGKSSWSSSASSAANRSNTSFTTSTWRASERSILLTATIGRKPTFSALPTTNLVCGIGPSAASTSTIAPSTMLRMRSTSPPKSAWPGVSTMLMRLPRHSTEVALARMVMPRSFSRSLESIARSATRSFSRNEPDCFRSSSTRVVLPWSTCAMIAMLRRVMVHRLNWRRKRQGPRSQAPRQISRAGHSRFFAGAKGCTCPSPHSRRGAHHHQFADVFRRHVADQRAVGIDHPEGRRSGLLHCLNAG